jgi:hypothetical protein
MGTKQNWFGYWWENIKPAKEGFDIVMAILTAVSLFVWAICKWGRFSNPIEDFITDAKLEQWGIIGAGTFYSFLCLFWHPFIRNKKLQQDHAAAIDNLEKEIKKLTDEIEDDRAKIEITPEFSIENSIEKRGLLQVKVVNNGKRIARIIKVAVIVENKQQTIVGTTITIPAKGITELVAHQSQIVVDLKEDGGYHVWQFPFTQNPYFEQTPKDDEQYGIGYVELTSKKQITFEFLSPTESDWVALAKIRNDVDPTREGHKCSKCGAVQMVHKPQYRPQGSYRSQCQCGHVDVLTP